MTLKRAYEIVLELAQENVLTDEHVYGDEGLQQEQREQVEAIDRVEEMGENAR